MLWDVRCLPHHLGEVLAVEEILERLLCDRPQSEKNVARGFLVPLLNIQVMYLQRMSSHRYGILAHFFFAPEQLLHIAPGFNRVISLHPCLQAAAAAEPGKEMAHVIIENS